MRVSDFLKIVDGHVCLAHLTMRRGERFIELFGMLHTAPASFFKRIRGQLETLENNGYCVLYENIEPSWAAPRTDQERALQRFALESRQAAFRRLRQEGFAHQSEEIPIRLSWTSADFSARDWDERDPDRRQPTMERIESLNRDLADARKFIASLIVVAAVGEVEFMEDSSTRHSLIVDDRNRHAVSKILRAAEDAHVCTFWGGAHLPGMRSELERHGFEVICTEWVPAIDVRDYETERV